MTLDASFGAYLRSPSVPRRLATFSPDTKVVVMLQDPITRIESFYRHWKFNKGLWKDVSLNALADSFLTYVDKQPGVAETLERLRRCDPRVSTCLAAGWSELVSLDSRSDSPEWVLFFGALYGYAMGPWRVHYFRPGRVMVVDANVYGSNRRAVMEQVVSFLYGRPMTAAEVAAATRPEFKLGPGLVSRLGSDHSTISAESKPKLGARLRAARAVSGPTFISSSSSSSSMLGAGGAGVSGGGAAAAAASGELSPVHRARLLRFFQDHLLGSLPATLQAMREEGAWVVGFEDGPWQADAASGGHSDAHGGALGGLSWRGRLGGSVRRRRW